MNSSRYRFDTESVEDFAALCKRFVGNTLQSPYRSTVPLLDLVENNPAKWNSFLESLGAPASAPVHFEYCVGSPKQGGNPSQTDALVVSDSNVWAIEAKWTEPRYPTVAERVSKKEADGADSRITVTGWLQHLNRFAARPLQVEDVSAVVYQTLHRAASACAVATELGGSPHLAYLHFHPSPQKSSATTAQYIADLSHLHTLLGSPVTLAFSVAEIPVTPTSIFNRIKDLSKGSPATARQVSEALREGPLFTYGPAEVTQISKGRT